MYKTILLTGIPRSGSTLSCSILNEFENTVALMEPMEVMKIETSKGSVNACFEISNFAFESRKKILYEAKVSTRQQGGIIPTNPIQEIKAQKDSLRKPIVSLGEMEISKVIEKDFTLVIKHNAFFTAILDHLISFFPCYGIIRNPLSVLASWATVDLPVHDGHIPAGERFDSTLKNKLENTNDVLERQIMVLDWFFERFDRLLPQKNILKYEDIILKDGWNFNVMAYAGAKREQKTSLKSKNSNRIYQEVDIDLIYKKLIQTQSIFWKYYTLEEMNEVYKDLLFPSYSEG